MSENKAITGSWGLRASNVLPAALALLLLSIVIVACQSPEETTVPTPTTPAGAAATPTPTDTSTNTSPSAAAEAQYSAFPQDGVPEYGGVIRVVGGDQPSLNFLDSVAGGFKQDVAFMYSTLVQMDPLSGYLALRDPGPGLAESWTTNEAGTIWTFKIRENVRFHDGTTLTAQDVKASLDHYLDPAPYNPPGASSIQPFVERVDAPDDQTVVITLKSPSATILFFLANQWNPIVAKSDLDKGVEWFETNANGTGPFKFNFDRWERGVTMVFERNEDYWKEGLPFLDGIQRFHIADQAAILSAFEVKQLDEAGSVSAEYAQTLKNQHGDSLEILRERGVGTNFYVMNTRIPPFDDPRVRQAVYLWLDRQRFVDLAADGVGYLADWINAEVFNYGMTSTEIQEHHLAYKSDKTEAREKAKELLNAAGYSDPSGVTIRVVYRGGSARLAAAQVMQDQLNQMGFDANIYVADQVAGLRALDEGEFEVGISGFPTPFLGEPDYMLGRGVSPNGQLNQSGIEDPEMEALLQEVYGTLDPTRRAELIQEVDSTLQEGAWPIGLLYWADLLTMRWDYNKGRKYITTYEDTFERVWLKEHAPTR